MSVRNEWAAMQHQQELLHLVAADTHILEGRARIRRQIALVRELRAKGNDTAQAMRLLELLRESIALQCEHRALIRVRLAELAGR